MVFSFYSFLTLLPRPPPSVVPSSLFHLCSSSLPFFTLLSLHFSFAGSYSLLSGSSISILTFAWPQCPPFLPNSIHRLAMHARAPFTGGFKSHAPPFADNFHFHFPEEGGVSPPKARAIITRFTAALAILPFSFSTSGHAAIRKFFTTLRSQQRPAPGLFSFREKLSPQW